MLQPRGLFDQIEVFCLCFTALAYFKGVKKTLAGALWRLLQVSLLAISPFSAKPHDPVLSTPHPLEVLNPRQPRTEF